MVQAFPSKSDVMKDAVDIGWQPLEGLPEHRFDEIKAYRESVVEEMLEAWKKNAKEFLPQPRDVASLTVLTLQYMKAVYEAKLCDDSFEAAQSKATDMANRDYAVVSAAIHKIQQDIDKAASQRRG